jgi:hypothetical protein
MLEKLGFEQLIEETLTVKRVTRAMSMYQFILAMVFAVYVGYSRLHHLQFLKREPMLTGILKCCSCHRSALFGGSWPRCTWASHGNCWKYSGG